MTTRSTTEVVVSNSSRWCPPECSVIPQCSAEKRRTSGPGDAFTVGLLGRNWDCIMCQGSRSRTTTRFSYSFFHSTVRLLKSSQALNILPSRSPTHSQFIFPLHSHFLFLGANQLVLQMQYLKCIHTFFVLYYCYCLFYHRLHYFIVFFNFCSYHIFCIFIWHFCTVLMTPSSNFMLLQNGVTIKFLWILESRPRLFDCLADGP